MGTQIQLFYTVIRTLFPTIKVQKDHASKDDLGLTHQIHPLELTEVRAEYTKEQGQRRGH